VSGVVVQWIDASSRGDGSERLTNGQIPALLSGVEPIAAENGSARYLGEGDVLRNALLKFAPGARVRIDGLLVGCTIELGDEAELVIGPRGVLASCTVTGTGRIVVQGKFYEGKSPGIVGLRAIDVREHAVLVAAVEQASVGAMFAFERGSKLRLKVLRPRTERTSRRAS
jgi:hypothetical protein